MIGISNADRKKAVGFLRAYASLLQEQGMHSTKEKNMQRMALNLDDMMERKPALPVHSAPDRKPLQPQKVITDKS